MSKEEKILVLDFGSQYSQLIARRIRECRVYSQVVPFSTPAEKIAAENPSGVILSGGPASVYADAAPQVDPGIFELGVPVLGICYGMQLLIHTLGGRVAPGAAREFGRAEMEVTDAGDPLFSGVPGRLSVWMSHGDKVVSHPAGARVLARTANTENAAVVIPDCKLYGIQFHPEVVHTSFGTDIIRNFCLGICGCSGNWNMSNFIEASVRSIRETVGDRRVILGLSGGVDSSVAAALIHRAIGKQLTCIFVDNGLLRKNEAAEVKKLFGDNFQMNLLTIVSVRNAQRPCASVCVKFTPSFTTTPLMPRPEVSLTVPEMLNMATWATPLLMNNAFSNSAKNTLIFISEYLSSYKFNFLKQSDNVLAGLCLPGGVLEALGVAVEANNVGAVQYVRHRAYGLRLCHHILLQGLPDILVGTLYGVIYRRFHKLVT